MYHKITYYVHLTEGEEPEVVGELAANLAIEALEHLFVNEEIVGISVEEADSVPEEAKVTGYWGILG